MIGIVCDAAEARALEASLAAVLAPERRPRPSPASGRSRGQLDAALDERRAPARDRVGRLVEADRARRREHDDRPRRPRTRATTAAARPRPQRSAPSTASPASSAVNDDCDSVSTSPAHSSTSAAAQPATSAVRRLHSSTAVSPSMTVARKRP